jgi:hypothetical protein
MSQQSIGSASEKPRRRVHKYLMISLNVSGVVSDGICDPKIYQFELPADKDEIGRLEVGVHDLFLMDHVYGLKHLVATINRSAPRNRWKE